MITTKICNKEDFDTEEFKNWSELMKEEFRYHRKLWEYCTIAQALKERNMLKKGKRGIGFAVGEEPLPSLFASKGCRILATDQEISDTSVSLWGNSSQLSKDKESLNKRQICDPDQFEELVEFRRVDMNNMPYELLYAEEKFDFAWSACSIEHLGTLKKGFDFILNTLHLLKPGGWSIHTTEYNISSNSRTNDNHLNNIYRKVDLEDFERLITMLGHYMEPISVERGEHPYNYHIDTPPYVTGDRYDIIHPDKQIKAHINLRIDSFNSTSIIIIVRKGKWSSDHC